MKLSVYFAGELFSAKHLAGNARLAAAIQRQSEGEISCLLPQTLENRAEGPHFIRDKDLETLINADLALFNFDGCEIDSGTVAEFMVAKFADVPALLLRTDFRRGGDQGEDPWNLMLSFYPRTSVCCLDSMALYKKALSAGLDPLAASELMLDQIGAKVVPELYSLARLEPILPMDSAKVVGDWIARFPGFRSPEAVARVREGLVRRRRRNTV
ncbi:MAG: nucleoside 2-deoxyribosyltransferase [Verrucomicrobia bacterium]|nr:nucleoside 2-deoxyribosyltransferase [Verrucomicrobiota bacterium]MBV9275396.1 nucleoside 2-deoxyribosyltransferase [Verrucomicrobiota bacterium]